ncbi:MAG: flippase-like domain-containing protein [Caldimicrobium sp.]|nr:flippase-like domain-containing protein [Caldimicrobium sp.]MDW8094997.1 flippase-like domain-containing protein [Caldimicrobium sp.]
MKFTMFRNFLYGLILTLVIIVLSFAYLSYKYIPKDVLEIVGALEWKYFSYTLFTLFLYHTFDTLRVIIIARAIGVNYSLWYGYLVSFTNTFGATITPAHLGGEVLPLYTLSRRGGQFYQIMTIVTMKGVSGFLFYVIFFPLTLQALIKDTRQMKEFGLIVGALLVFSLLVYILYRILLVRTTKEKGNFLYKLRRTLLRYLVTCRIFIRTQKLTFLIALMLSILLYFSFLFMGIFLVKAFNPQANLKEVFLDQLPLLYAIFISPTPGGSGVGELGALPIFSPHLEGESLGVFVILWRILSQYLSAFIGGLIFVFFLLTDILKSKNKWPSGNT